MSKGFKPPTAEELNPYFEGFEVERFIAQGGMGAVFAATQVSLDRPVAIKILPYELGLDDQFHASFETEAKAMARLNHPNLVQVYDFGDIEGMLYIIMELVPGRSLYESAHGKSVEMDEACRLIAAMARGLAHAHESGLIHRDIKPANVLIDEDANPKIVDFGLARPLDNTHDGGTIYGTKGYTAPEVTATPNDVDQRADIFSLGVMLYELLTGTLPPQSYIPASQISDSDTEFDAIILKAIHPKRDFRYQSAADMADELDLLAERLVLETQPADQQTSPLLATAATSTRPATRAYSPRPVLVKKSSGSPATGIFIGILILSIIIAIFSLSRNDSHAPDEDQSTSQQEADRLEAIAALEKQKKIKARQLLRQQQKEARLQRAREQQRKEDQARLIKTRQIEEKEEKIRQQKIAEQQRIEQQKIDAENLKKEQELAAKLAIPPFSHNAFIDELRSKLAKSSAQHLRSNDTKLTKNVDRFIRSAKRDIRRVEKRNKRKTAQLKADVFFDQIKEDKRLPAEIDKSLKVIEPSYEKFIILQNKIDDAFEPLLKAWQVAYIAKIKLKITTLHEEVHADSIDFLIDEISLAEDNPERILAIAKGEKTSDSEPEVDPED